jgi:hypothetical protein
MMVFKASFTTLAATQPFEVTRAAQLQQDPRAHIELLRQQGWPPERATQGCAASCHTSLFTRQVHLLHGMPGHSRQRRACSALRHSRMVQPSGVVRVQYKRMLQPSKLSELSQGLRLQPNNETARRSTASAQTMKQASMQGAKHVQMHRIQQPWCNHGGEHMQLEKAGH